MVELYRRRFEHYGHGPADQAIVGLGGQVFMRPNSQDAIREFRPYFDHAPVYGGGPSLEDYMDQTPMTIGSPQQVIDRTLGFREIVGDYQRQLFLADHAGLPLKTVLEQMDILGEQVVPGPAHGVRRRSGRRTCRTAAAPPAGRGGAGSRGRPPSGRRRGAPCRHERDAAPALARRRQRRACGQPSSTRLLADRLAAAAERHLRDAGIEPRVEVIELREHAQDLANHLLTGFPSPDAPGRDRCRPRARTASSP